MTIQKDVTWGQGTAFGFRVAAGVNQMLASAENLGSEEVQYLISDEENTIERIAGEVTQRILGLKIDPWVEEKRRIEKFYRKFFGREVDWSKLSVPAKQDGMNRLEVVFSDITEDVAFATYAKKFGANAVWNYYDSITGSIASQQERPTGDYAFCHVGGAEPDMLGKSYDDGINAGTKFMTPKEGIIAALRHRVETRNRNMYDVVGLTRFSALDSDGYAMRMFRSNDGRFNISGDYRDGRDPIYGLRQVGF